MTKLISKYNVPGPRYTSYPTVPFWKADEYRTSDWINSLEQNFNHFKNQDLSIYIHLPFCENLCTFCGCHKRITKNHKVEKPYIESLLAEWSLYKPYLKSKSKIKELHLGGGTPTFFSADMLLNLLQGIFKQSKVNPNEVELSLEAHPGNTSLDHLNSLFRFGFRRLSLGIQDYNIEVQRAINRLQSFESVKTTHNLAREIGYESISHDLVYGLPKQKLAHIHQTIDRTLELLPDRISLYSYAHVPWIKGLGQRGYSEDDLPQENEKRQLYEEAKKRLLEAGYMEIGMDHFALIHDKLAIAQAEKRLHRNFMGYTTQNTNLLIGLGMSAISDSWFSFAQNEKTVEAYEKRVTAGELPIFRGHKLSQIDIEIRQAILDLMCRFETDLSGLSSISLKNKIKENLVELIEDEIVSIIDDKVIVHNDGIAFVRNVAMCFDQYLPTEIQNNLFSKTI